MIVSIIQTIMIFLVPLLILNLRKTKFVKLIGMIGMAYLLGIAVSIIIFIINKCGIEFSLNKDVGEIGSYVAIAVAIPLLLFNSNLKEAIKLSKTVFKSVFIQYLSLILVTVVVFLCFKDKLLFSRELSGMAIGLYTGGTPNLNAIGSALGVDKNTIALANLSDMLIGGVFYVFLLILAKPFVDLFLGKYKNTNYLTKETDMKNYESLEKVPIKNVKGVFFCILLAVLMAVTSALFGIVLWFLMGHIEGEMFTYLIPSLLIGVTIFGIIASFSKPIQKVEGNNLVGQYLILVFSFALASSLNLNNLGNDFIYIILFFGIITIGTFIVDIIISKLFKMETDCTLVVLTAGIYGPAFVPAVCEQYKNEQMVVPGLIVGSIGYAIGTFLGLAISLLLMIF